MMFIPFKNMMLLHLLMGMGFTFFLALRAFQRHNNPHRRWFTFGGEPYSLGNIHKWVQWYCWAFVFEVLTSFLYAHTGMFYYELGMSIFEALAVTLGAFIVDRLTGILFLVEQDSDGDIDLGLINKVAKAKETLSAADTAAPSLGQTQADMAAKENEQFDRIIKGH